MNILKTNLLGVFWGVLAYGNIVQQWKRYIHIYKIWILCNTQIPYIGSYFPQ